MSEWITRWNALVLTKWAVGSKVRYRYWEFDYIIFILKSGRKYSYTNSYIFRYDAYYARWSPHNWSLGALRDLNFRDFAAYSVGNTVLGIWTVENGL